MRATVYVLLMSVVSSASGTLFTQEDSGGVKSPIILIPGDGGRRENIKC